ncbi:hypothetical protein PG984_011658 [Apiospora sp. TS-2023a]
MLHRRCLRLRRLLDTSGLCRDGLLLVGALIQLRLELIRRFASLGSLASRLGILVVASSFNFALGLVIGDGELLLGASSAAAFATWVASLVAARFVAAISVLDLVVMLLILFQVMLQNGHDDHLVVYVIASRATIAGLVTLVALLALVNHLGLCVAMYCTVMVETRLD